MMSTTITSKSVKGNKNYRGLAAHRKFRAAQIKDLHAHKMVINRVDIVKDKETKEVKEIPYLAIVDDSPLVREFGITNEVRPNTKAYDLDDKQNKKARRINIDGDKYIYADSIMVIQCEDKELTNKLADEGYMFNGQLYKAVNASPSNEKHATKYYFKVTEEIGEEEAFWKVDKIMGGSLSDKLMSKPVNGKEITKANTRLGNYASGMKCLATIDLTKERVALVKGSMDQACDFTPETDKNMREQGIKIDNNINDGASYFSTTVIKRMAANLNLPKLSNEDALQIAVQARTTVFTGKTLARTLTSETMEEIAKLHNAKYYGNPDGELVALFDTDGAKMVNMSALENCDTMINVYVMAVANASGVNTSSQHLIKYMAVNPEETVRIVKELATQALDNFVADKVESENESDSLTNNRIIAKIGRAAALQDAYLMESVLADTWKYAQSMIAKNKVRIPGIYTHMMFDMSYNLTRGLIKGILGITKDGFIEAYNPDLMEIYAEEIEAIENNPELTEEEKEAQLFEIFSGVVVKFPSAMPKEYEIVVYQTKRQIRNKIELAVAELNISNEEKEQMIEKLVEYFNTTPWGCTVYAPVNAMKNKLAGADVDFDATMCDMSALKHILIKERLNNKGFMGECTFISYEDIDRQPREEKLQAVAQEVEDLDI